MNKTELGELYLMWREMGGEELPALIDYRKFRKLTPQFGDTRRREIAKRLSRNPKGQKIIISSKDFLRWWADNEFPSHGKWTG